MVSTSVIYTSYSLYVGVMYLQYGDDADDCESLDYMPYLLSSTTCSNDIIFY